MRPEKLCVSLGQTVIVHVEDLRPSCLWTVTRVTPGGSFEATRLTQNGPITLRFNSQGYEVKVLGRPVIMFGSKAEVK